MDRLKLDQWRRFLADKLLVDTTMDTKNSINHMVKLCARLIRFDGDVVLAKKCMRVVKKVNNWKKCRNKQKSDKRTLGQRDCSVDITFLNNAPPFLWEPQSLGSLKVKLKPKSKSRLQED
jgi:hypothetical protein